MCRELLGIQKTLSNVGPELLGIQEDQRDASFKNREQGRWNEAKTGVSRINSAFKKTLPNVGPELLGIQEDPKGRHARQVA